MRKQTKMSIQVLYSDGEGTEIRCSSVKQHDAFVSFAPIAIKTVIQGTENYHFEKMIFRAQANKIIVGNQFSKARVLIDSQTEVKGMCIDFGQNAIDNYLQDLSVSNDFKDRILEGQILTGELKSQSIFLQKELFQLYHLLPDVTDGQFIKDTLSNLLDSYFQIQLFRLENAGYLPFKKEVTRIYNADILLDSKTFLEQQLDQEINLEVLSAQVGLSKFQLLRLFKHSFGKTPHQYLIELRLQKAKALLKTHPVNEVAQIVGFSDSSAFGKAFKGYFGLTASEFKLK